MISMQGISAEDFNESFSPCISIYCWIMRGSNLSVVRIILFIIVSYMGLE